MSYYLAHISYSVQSKNTLDEQFGTLLKECDRNLIPERSINYYMSDILNDYKKLCAANKRCKPRDLSFYFQRETGDYSLHGSHVTFKLLKSK